MAHKDDLNKEATYQMRSSCRTIEHKEIQATAMSVNFSGECLMLSCFSSHIIFRSGQWSLLAGRRVLALQNLDETNETDSVVRKFSRNCKYEVSSAEFANCQQTQEYCAIAVSS